MLDVLDYRVTGIAALIGCLLIPVAAFGAEPGGPQGERAAAEVVFEAGREAMAAGDYDEACEKFEASLRLDPAPGTLMNLGNCEEKRGRIASAWERYIAASRELPDTDRRKAFAAQKVEELEPHVPRLTLALAPEAPESTRIRREAIDLTGSVGIPLPLDPGTYVIAAVADGYEKQEFELTIGLGESKGLTVGPGEKLPEPPPSASVGVGVGDPAVKWGPLTKRQWGYVAGGVGLAGFATMLTSGVLAYGEAQTMDEECDYDTNLCSIKGDNARKSGRKFALISNISGAVGVLALGTGVYLVVTSKGATVGPSDAPKPSPRKPTESSQKPRSVSAQMEIGSFGDYSGFRMTGLF
jgi:tetratricopeptide (TPR) repeat protein